MKNISLIGTLLLGSLLYAVWNGAQADTSGNTSGTILQNTDFRDNFTDFFNRVPKDIIVEVDRVPPVAEPVPPAAPPPPPVVGPRDPAVPRDLCETEMLQKIYAAIEACWNAPEPLKCVSELPDQTQKDYYVRLCQNREEKPPEPIPMGTGGINKAYPSATAVRAYEDAKEAGYVLDNYKNMEFAPRAIVAPGTPLLPCECLAMIEKKLQEGNHKLCETKACEQPPPSDEVVPNPPKEQVPSAPAPKRNPVEMSGSCFGSITPVRSIGDLGWISLFLSTLPVLLRRYRK